MPGCKRKMDDDTWLVSQSKKNKSNPSSQSVYDSTLAKLRVGTRKYFSPQEEIALTSLSLENNNQQEAKICSDCRILNDKRKLFVDKCNFCDKTACHLSSCINCGEFFCYNCYLRRYDDPTTEQVICISCLH